MRGPAFFRQKAGKRDSNHAAIRDGLRHLGFFVVDLAGVTGGVADLLVFSRRSEAPMFLEVKAGKGKLNALQLAWRERAEARGVRVECVKSLDEALAALIGDAARCVDANVAAVTAMHRCAVVRNRPDDKGAA